MLRCNTNNVLDAPYSEYNNFVEQTFCLPIKNNIDKYLIKIISQNMVDVDAFIEIDLKDIKFQTSDFWTTKVEGIPCMSIGIIKNNLIQLTFQDIC